MPVDTRGAGSDFTIRFRPRGDDRAVLWFHLWGLSFLGLEAEKGLAEEMPRAQ